MEPLAHLFRETAAKRLKIVAAVAQGLDASLNVKPKDFSRGLFFFVLWFEAIYSTSTQGPDIPNPPPSTDKLTTLTRG